VPAAPDNSQLKGAVIDIVRFFEIARRFPSAGERILEKTVAKVIRNSASPVENETPSNERVGAASVEEPFLAELTAQ
jgi:hypothetical protein